MDLGRLLLRGVVGPLFVGHGTQKLFGWFDGHGLAATGQFFESVGLRPGRRHALAAGAAEAGGGALLAAVRERARAAAADLAGVTYRWVPAAENARADALVAELLVSAVPSRE